MNINKSLRARNLRGPLAISRGIHGIVLHDTAGSGTVGDVHYLATDPEKRGVSVDFVITRDGTVWQLNPDPRRFYTFHAGRHTRFKSGVNGQVNAMTIGIELSHKANPALQQPLWPTEQVQAAAELCKFLTLTYNISPEDITTHAKVITDGSRSDPRQFPFPQFWAFFNGDDHLTGEPAPPQTTDIGIEKYDITVKDGDTLWGLAQTYHTTVEQLKLWNNLNTASNVITVGQALRVK
jgi:N-acetyl-anhydromuramyl-L-alanine amidase AmpD